MDHAALVPDEGCDFFGCQSIVDAVARQHNEVVHIMLDLEEGDFWHSNDNVWVASIALKLGVRVPYRARYLVFVFKR